MGRIYYYLSLLVLAIPLSITAESVSFTFGAGRAYFTPDIVKRQKADAFYSEAFTGGAPSIVPAVFTSFSQEPSIQLPVRLDLTSNDLAISLFHRWSFQSSSNLVTGAGNVVSLTKDDTGSGEERYLGLQFGHRLYFMNDLLEVRPVWAFTQYVFIHEKSRFDLARTTNVVPPVTSTIIEQDYRGKSRVNGLRAGIEFTYILSESYELSGGLYYMPSRSGSFSSQTLYLSELTGRSGGDDIRLTQGATVFEDTGLERAYKAAHLTLSYLVNPNVSLNLTGQWKRWTTIYTAPGFSSGFGIASVTVGNQSAGGALILYDYEPYSDWLIYAKESHQDTSSIVFSVTFRTGEYDL